VDYPSLGLSYAKTKKAAELRAADFAALGRLTSLRELDTANVKRGQIAYGYKWAVDWSKRAPTLAEDLRATLTRVGRKDVRTAYCPACHSEQEVAIDAVEHRCSRTGCFVLSRVESDGEKVWLVLRTPVPTQAERLAEGCDCGEFGGSPKTCPVHGYEGTDPDVRERARKLNPQEQDLFERMDARLVELDGLVTGYPRPLRLVRDTRADLHTLRFVRERR
jgi:hypothetical protein